MARRILVLRLSSLGDVVLTAPVYKNLKAHWPEARVCVLVKPQFAPVLENNPCIDEVLPYRGLLKTLREIRRRGFTHLLDLHATWRTFWIRHLSGIANVSVYRKNALARRLYVLFRRSSPVLFKHSLDRYLESLAAWGVPVRHRDLALGDYGSVHAGNGARPKPDAQPETPGETTERQERTPPETETRTPRSLAPPRGGGAYRVLIVQTSFLGDALLTLPLARRVAEIIGGCRISVLTRPETVSVFQRSPWIDEVIEDDKRGASASAAGLLRLARDLRGRGFDLALVAHRSFRSALLAWLAGIPHRIGFTSSAGSFLFHQKVFFPWGMPDLERNLALLLPLKPDLRADREDSLYLASAKNSRAIAARLAESGIGPGDRLVGIHPGSVWPTKRWLPERYALLVNRLVREAGVRVVIVGGPGDRELAGRIARAADVAALDWTGKTTLPELLELAGRLSLLVTNDSGPMHITAAHGVATLAIFGPTTRELGFFPYGEGHRVLEADLACRPCGLHGSRACPEGHFLCMGLISVDEAYRNAVELLEGVAAKEPA
ncbi:MAG: glycosyltransferase family 9 protein [Elusimicrobiota bacterium]